MKKKEKKGEEFERISKCLLEEYLKEELEIQKKVEIGLSIKKEHKFDFGNSDYLVECKAYDWTKGKNTPSGKISTLKETLLYFLLAPKSYKKVLVLKKSKIKNSETLLDYFIRLNRYLISDDLMFFEIDEENSTIENKSIKERE
ncbi:hypothetical protein [Fusobacterium sp. HMSC073F01]|uniref:hypothetical protein n=1 Tax=Fusobacterium sp. HMSC073F01 TaxID=1739251 RepID=UPI0008A5704E|nr:hypothetical protein [Fusobacterium sp. HMSC073F01]OFL94319.1 hypothetical protein HMPREF2747_16070 [Fusobacterium sp. HMSC073F01]